MKSPYVHMFNVIHVCDRSLGPEFHFNSETRRCYYWSNCHLNTQHSTLHLHSRAHCSLHSAHLHTCTLAVAHMKTFCLCIRLLLLVGIAVSAVSGIPIKSKKSQISVSPTPKSPLSRFDKKVIQVFNDAGSNTMDFGECYQLVRNIYRKVSRAAIILPPSRGSVQKLLTNPTDRVSRVDFINLARELRHSTLTGLAISLALPPAAMIVATQVPDEAWLSLDLWIVELVNAIAPNMALPVVNAHGIVNTTLLVCLALLLGNTLMGLINTLLWIGAGKDQTVVVPRSPSVPKHMIPAEPLEPLPILVEQQPGRLRDHHPEPMHDVDVTDLVAVGETDSSAFAVAPLLALAASAVGGVAAFSMDKSSRPSQQQSHKIMATTTTTTTPSRTSAPKQTTSPPPPPPPSKAKKEPAAAAAAVDANKTKKTKKKNTPDEDAAPKKEKPPVGRIAAGGAIVGCLQYAATVARFVGVLLP